MTEGEIIIMGFGFVIGLLVGVKEKPKKEKKQ